MTIESDSKKYVQVTLTNEEWKLLRWYAYEIDVSTVNKLMKEVTLKAAEDYKMNG